MEKKRYTRTDEQKAYAFIEMLASENNMSKEDNWLLTRHELIRYKGKNKSLSMEWDKKYIITFTTY